MKKTKLTELLSAFSNQEIKRFKNYLNSDYFNTKKHLISAFEYLEDFHPDYGNEKLDEEDIFKKAYPGKKYNYALLKNLLSDIYEHSKNFMASEELRQSKLSAKNMFMNNLYKKTTLRDLIRKEIKIADQLYADETLAPLYFDDRYSYEKSKCSYISHANQYEEYNDVFNGEVKSFIDMTLFNLLDYALCFEILTVSYENTTFKDEINKAIDIFCSDGNIPNKVNKILYSVLQLLRTNDEKYYFELVEMLKDEDKYLNPDTKLKVYQPLEVFLVKKVKSGDNRFYRHQFELYKHCFESGLYENENFFAEAKLLAAVETAIRIREFDWMEKTINENIHKVSEKNRDEYYNFCMAKIVQAKGDNKKALDMLNKVNLDTSPLKTMARNILLKIYFEMSYFEQAKTMIDTYRHFLRRDSGLSEEYKDSVYNFLKLYNKLIDFKIDKDPEKIRDFEYDINSADNIILKQWLIEMTDKIKKEV
ncbi:MAG: hypothetical protein HOP31_12605 [Ignavibacteria bacterium]|nr:hypothetical protein [Ignavibacteria bacterium]